MRRAARTAGAHSAAVKSKCTIPMELVRVYFSIPYTGYEILRSSFQRKFDKANFISPKRTPPQSPHHLGLRLDQGIETATVRLLDTLGYLLLGSTKRMLHQGVVAVFE